MHLLRYNESSLFLPPILLSFITLQTCQIFQVAFLHQEQQIFHLPFSDLKKKYPFIPPSLVYIFNPFENSYRHSLIRGMILNIICNLSSLFLTEFYYFLYICLIFPAPMYIRDAVFHFLTHVKFLFRLLNFCISLKISVKPLREL